MEHERPHHTFCNARTPTNHAFFVWADELESALDICDPYCVFCEKTLDIGAYSYQEQHYCLECVEEVLKFQKCPGVDYIRNDNEADLLKCCTDYFPSIRVTRLKRALNDKDEPLTKQIKV